MGSIRKFLAVGTFVTAAAAIVIPSTALAAALDGVVFRGSTTSLDCGTGCNGIPTVGGSGGYTFTTSGLCKTVDADNDGDGGSLAANCTIDSTGTYKNTVCGTGSAAGTATITLSNGEDDIDYTITFVAGVGVIGGTSTEKDSAGAVTGSGPLHGAVQISPATAPSGSTCTTGFNVVGMGAAQS